MSLEFTAERLKCVNGSPNWFLYYKVSYVLQHQQNIFLNVFNELYYNRFKIIKREAGSSINRSNNISPSPYSHILYYIILCYVINIMLYFLLRYIYIYIYIYIYKKWLRFFKNGCNWGGWGIFTYLQLSLHSWQRVLTPLFYEDYPLFFKFCPNPPLLPLPSHLQTYPHCSFCCPVSLAEFVITPHLMCYFT